MIKIAPITQLDLPDLLVGREDIRYSNVIQEVLDLMEIGSTSPLSFTGLELEFGRLRGELSTIDYFLYDSQYLDESSEVMLPGKKLAVARKLAEGFEIAVLEVRDFIMFFIGNVPEEDKVRFIQPERQKRDYQHFDDVTKLEREIERVREIMKGMMEKGVPTKKSIEKWHTELEVQLKDLESFAVKFASDYNQTQDIRDHIRLTFQKYKVRKNPPNNSQVQGWINEHGLDGAKEVGEKFIKDKLDECGIKYNG